MTLRIRIQDALKDAMKAKEPARLSTLRLINAAIKDREIAMRGGDQDDAASLSDGDLIDILSKMVKQRQESARAYEEAGRLELAAKESEEIGFIREFLPQEMDEDEVTAAITAAISETGASSIRDMGKVMGHLKAQYAGRMDFGKVGALVKNQL